jgi:hypothetical protein
LPNKKGSVKTPLSFYLKGKIMINKHLMKEFPVYSVANQSYKVKLLKAIKTSVGLVFTAEIMNGRHKGKWTTVNKKDLKIKD